MENRIPAAYVVNKSKPSEVVPLDEVMLFAFKLQSSQADEHTISESLTRKFDLDQTEAREISQSILKELNPEDWRILKGKTNFQPTYAELGLTWRCNLRCKHCYAFSLNNEAASNNEMSTEEWIDILKQLKSDLDVPVIAFIGGEPLLREDIVALVKFSLDLGFDSVGISSNGTAKLLGQKLVNVMKSERERTFFQISLEGASATTHDSVRGKGSFDSTIRGIKKLVDAGIRVGISEVVIKRNYNETAQLIKLTEQLNVISLTFNSLRPAGKGANIWEEDVSPDEWNKLADYLLSARQRLKGKLKIEFDNRFAYKRLFGDDDVKFPELLVNSNLIGCESKRSIYLTPEGFILPCFVLALDRRFYSKKSARTTKLLEIWEEDSNVALLREIEQKGIRGACQTCKYYPVCQGGCHYVSYFVNGDFSMPDPRCPLGSPS